MNSRKNRTHEFPSVFLGKVEELRFFFSVKLYAEDVFLKAIFLHC